MSHNSIFATQKRPETVGSKREEYFWKDDAKDGARSYSYMAATKDNSVLLERGIYSVPTGVQNENGINQFAYSRSGKAYQKVPNLYNWIAATAGSGKELSTIDIVAEDSICPKGWKMPSSTRHDYGLIDNQNFNVLTHDIYKIKNSTGAIDNLFDWNEYKNTDFNKIYTFPINFSPNGNFVFDYGTISNILNNSGIWSNTVSETDEKNARYMYVFSGQIISRGNNERGYGRLVRCVAR